MELYVVHLNLIMKCFFNFFNGKFRYRSHTVKVPNLEHATYIGTPCKPLVDKLILIVDNFCIKIFSYTGKFKTNDYEPILFSFGDVPN